MIEDLTSTETQLLNLNLNLSLTPPRHAKPLFDLNSDPSVACQIEIAFPTISSPTPPLTHNHMPLKPFHPDPIHTYLPSHTPMPSQTQLPSLPHHAVNPETFTPTSLSNRLSLHLYPFLTTNVHPKILHFLCLYHSRARIMLHPSCPWGTHLPHLALSICQMRYRSTW